MDCCSLFLTTAAAFFHQKLGVQYRFAFLQSVFAGAFPIWVYLICAAPLLPSQKPTWSSPNDTSCGKSLAEMSVSFGSQTDRVPPA